MMNVGETSAEFHRRCMEFMPVGGKDTEFVMINLTSSFEPSNPC